MLVNGQHYRTIWETGKPASFTIIDQRWLPHQFTTKTITSSQQTATAIHEMWVRGAPLIGATAAYGMYLATLEASQQSNFNIYMKTAIQQLLAARPTAVNLAWAVNRVWQKLQKYETAELKVQQALNEARNIANEDIAISSRIGDYGLPLIEQVSTKKNGAEVNILTHCNAGWLATVDWGTATAPIYKAHNQGIKLHVWVDETRPRNQGARLTAWELAQHGIPHTVIVDNTGGHLMQHQMVDMCLVGTDRTTRTGDVANKIGTYLKALAAHDNNIPFYVALPTTSIDWTISNGIKEIPIEKRQAKEVTHIQGLYKEELKKVLLTPKQSNAVNYGFDVTPARLITALITERGIVPASEVGIAGLQ